MNNTTSFLIFLSRIYVILLILLISSKLSATHRSVGGSISWECNNGLYTFYVKHYVNCNSIPFLYYNTNRALQIHGNPLPRSSSNAYINSIILYPDTSRFHQNGSGTTDIICTQGNSIYDCSSNNPRGYIQYFFKSDPIQLNGVPPQSGWRFYYSSTDTRWRMDNILSNTKMVLSATLFRNAQLTSSVCYESSPRFAEMPNFFYCRGLNYQHSEIATDLDDDRMVYRLSRPIVAIDPSGLPIYVNYKPNFSAQAPLPSQLINPNNIPLSYNAQNGMVDFKVASGSSIIGYYLLKFSVDSYRDGIKISTVNHEYPMAINDCPLLPSQVQNATPRINPPFYKGGNTFTYSDSVIAGNTMNFNISVLDTNTYNNALQNLRIELSGDQLSNDLSSASNCPIASDTNCAIMLQTPQFDAIRNTYYYSVNRNWTGLMSWQTDCDDLGPNGSPKTHYFYVKAQDDHCPIPGRVIQSLAITVLPNPNNCPGTSTSISSHGQLMNEVQVFPNPSNGLVHIQGESLIGVRMRLFDLSARLLMEGRLSENNTTFDLPEESGVYILELQDQGGSRKHLKLIKK